MLRELIKIYPDEQVAIHFLQRCLLRQRPLWLLNLCRFGHLLFAALFIAFESYLSLFPFAKRTPAGRSGCTVIIGILLLACGENSHAWQSQQKAIRFGK